MRFSSVILSHLMGLKAAEEDAIRILGARYIRSEVDAPAKDGMALGLGRRCPDEHKFHLAQVSHHLNRLTFITSKTSHGKQMQQ